MVHAADGEAISNIYQLEYENPTNFVICRLEKVKSAEDAQRIKLVECLEEEVWKTSPSDEDGSNELVFSTLVFVSIQGCPNLRFKPCVPVLVKHMIIYTVAMK